MVQQKIKEYLRLKGIKYRRVINDTGLSPSTWTAIMSGKRKLRADEFFSICKSLDVSPEIFAPDQDEIGV